jgi:hypothetical protein
MNFIKNLFRHSRHSANAPPADLVNWPGESGQEYPYTIYQINTAFPMSPGNFIYARQNEDGGWVPIYIAQTRNLGQRLEGHVTVNDAIQNGATHIHAHFDTVGQAARCSEERDLRLRWKPVCNDLLES